MNTEIILLAAAMLFIGMRTVRLLLSMRVRVVIIRPDSVPGTEEMKAYIQAIRSAAEEREKGTLEEYYVRLTALADTDAPGQAIVYDEEHSLLLISAAIIARISQGEAWLKRKVQRIARRHPGCRIIIGSFGCKR